MRRGSEVMTSNRMNVVFAVMMNSSGNGNDAHLERHPHRNALGALGVESLAALGLLRHILLVDALELLFQRRLLRGASRLGSGRTAGRRPSRSSATGRTSRDI